MDAGALVPDDVIMQVTKERLGEPDCAGGYILDGLPRTLAQAHSLDEIGARADVALSIEISDGEIVRRMAGRRVCSGCGATYHVDNKPPKTDDVCDECGARLTIRADDKPEVVLNRLEVYHAQTEPLKEFYGSRGILKTVENVTGVESMTAVILETLGL
jgi:adenylate kinase